MQLYYFWKKLCQNYKSKHLKSTFSSHYANNTSDNSSNQLTNNSNNILQNDHNSSVEFFDLVNNDPDTECDIGSNQPQNHHQNSEIRSHICEMPDCSAVKRSLYQ